MTESPKVEAVDKGAKHPFASAVAHFTLVNTERCKSFKCQSVPGKRLSNDWKGVQRLYEMITATAQSQSFPEFKSGMSPVI